jgi:hypothetical protein
LIRPLTPPGLPAEPAPDPNAPQHMAAIALDATVGNGIRLAGATGPTIDACIGTPEGAVVAPIGSLRVRSNGGLGTCLYVKESGTGNVGWVTAATTGAAVFTTLRVSTLGVGLVRSDNAGNFTSSTLVDQDVAANAAIAWTKISPNIVNADVNAAAAIAGSKVNPQFGNQQVATTATVTCGSLKATTLATAGLAHTDAAGNFSTSLLVDADVSPNANVAGSKVNPNFAAQNISTSGSCAVGAVTCTTLAPSGASTLQGATCTTLTASSTVSLAATTAQTLTVSALGAGTVRSSAGGVLSIVTAQSITGVLSNVTDANAKAVLTSIINALTAAAPGPAIATNNTT